MTGTNDRKTYQNMTDKPLVSVLIPAYHVEKYLERCLESVCKQTYQNIEIIVVDDASPDRSGEIAEEYAGKDGRIQVLHHTKNQGFSGARNTAIAHATGQYVTFVDSDDWVEPDYVEYLLYVMVETDGDVAISKNFFTSRYRKQVEEDSVCSITPEDMLCDIFYNRIHVGVWNRLYKSELLVGRKFRIESKTGEGMQFNTQVVPAAKSIGVGLRRIYTYNVDNDMSATKKPNVENQALGAVENMEFIKKSLRPRSERLDAAVEYQYFTTVLYALGHLVRAGAEKQYAEVYQEFVQYCRKTAPTTLWKMEISGKQKLKSLLVWVSPRLEVKLAIWWRYKLGVKQRV